MSRDTSAADIRAGDAAPAAAPAQEFSQDGRCTALLSEHPSPHDPGPATRPAPLRIGVLISGGGSTLQNLIDRIRDGRLAGVEIRVVIASRERIEGVNRARRAGLPVAVVRPRDSADVNEFSRRVVRELDSAGVELAVQGGWLCHWKPPVNWLGRVLNVHPALLPDFGGKGFYGRRVHESVLAAGRRVSGATVHQVDEHYDHGPVILQRSCPVLIDDTPETLSARVAEVEREILPAAIEMARDGRLPGFTLRP